jgi:hypothetical protein
VYSRADHWRTVVIVAPFLTAVSADAVLREFRAANARAVE